MLVSGSNTSCRVHIYHVHDRVNGSYFQGRSQFRTRCYEGRKRDRLTRVGNTEIDTSRKYMTRVLRRDWSTYLCCEGCGKRSNGVWFPPLRATLALFSPFFRPTSTNTHFHEPARSREPSACIYTDKCKSKVHVDEGGLLNLKIRNSN